ncbi:MAG: GGDEF domain-containing protein [Eubacteriales bacterium]|nr:GGDEF domain-containing protein [Eubacteriales bacterium]
MWWIRSIKQNTEKEKQRLLNNQAELDTLRERLVLILVTVLPLVTILQWGLSFFTDSLTQRRPAYLTISVILLVIELFYRLWKRPQFTYFLIAITLTAYEAVKNSYYTPGMPSTMEICILFIIPLFLPMKSIYVTGIQMCSAILYMLIAMPIKPAFIRGEECINIVLASLVALILGQVERKAILENYELKRIAYIEERTDTLTGVCNRRKLFEDVKALESEYTGDIGLFVLDIDYFKDYNDTYGHLQGDECLKAISRLLRTVGQSASFDVYRYGGEEFVGLVKNQTAIAVGEICERIRREVEDLQLRHIKSVNGIVTVCIGYSVSNAQQRKNYEALFLEADTAVYKAKESGKNRVIRFS